MILEPSAKTYLAGALQALNVSGGMTAHRLLAAERDRQLYLFAFHDALIGIALTVGLELDLGECPCPLPPAAPRVIVGPEPPLTARELEIGRLLLAGRSRKEIAHDLVLSSWTIKSHTDKLYRKLGIHSKGELRAHMEQRPEVEATAPA